MKNKSEKKDRRLYVLIDNTLAPVYGAVQGGHAVAQYMIENGIDFWENEYLIYLRCNVRYWSKKLARMNVPHSKFYEPDLHGKLTAISVCCDKKVFKRLKLLSC